MTVELDFDIATAPPIEEQLSVQGATLGGMVNRIQNALEYCQYLYVWGYLAQSEAYRGNERIYKDVKANVRMMEEVE